MIEDSCNTHLRHTWYYQPNHSAKNVTKNQTPGQTNHKDCAAVKIQEAQVQKNVLNTKDNDLCKQKITHEKTDLTKQRQKQLVARNTNQSYCHTVTM